MDRIQDSRRARPGDSRTKDSAGLSLPAFIHGLEEIEILDGIHHYLIRYTPRYEAAAVERMHETLRQIDEQCPGKTTVRIAGDDDFDGLVLRDER